MWDPSLLSGNSELIRVLEEGFRPAAVYEVCSVLRFILIDESQKQQLAVFKSDNTLSENSFHKSRELIFFVSKFCRQFSFECCSHFVVTCTGERVCFGTDSGAVKHLATTPSKLGRILRNTLPPRSTSISCCFKCHIC